jgi:NAD(P)-dependent dehydrogenase (short-subunit alcohol dehydrogenase family)
MDLELRDKVIVVIGGTSNLGKGACVELVQEEAKIVAAYYADERKADKTTSHIRSLGGDFKTIRADASKEEDSERIFQFALDQYGRIDGLIYSAMYYDTCKLVDMSLEHWERAMAVNLTGAFLANRWAVRYWTKNKMAGRIVNFTSVNAFQGDHIPHAYYAASKAGIIGFTKSLCH